MTITNEYVHNAINDQFTQYKRNKTSRADRMAFVTAVTEQYFAEHDRMPPHTLLDRMATLILQDELADKHPDKMTREEYPLLSDSQADERYKVERSIKAAQDVATDGLDYRVKTRDSNRRLREVFG